MLMKTTGGKTKGRIGTMTTNYEDLTEYWLGEDSWYMQRWVYNKNK